MKIYSRGVLVACATDCEISVDVDTVEVLPASDWRWPEYVEGKRSWSASTGGLVAVEHGFELSEFFNGLNTTFDFSCTVGEITYSGKAITKSCSISSSARGILKYKLALQGSAKLSVVGKVIEATIEDGFIDDGAAMNSYNIYSFVLSDGELYLKVPDGQDYLYFSSWRAAKYPASDELNSTNYIVLAGGHTYDYNTTQQKWIQRS